MLRHGRTARKFLGKFVRHSKNKIEVKANDFRKEQLAQQMNPLDRIGEYLLHQGLSRRVHVRFDSIAGDFVLEDDHGCIHAKNYDGAVAIVERTWL